MCYESLCKNIKKITVAFLRFHYFCSSFGDPSFFVSRNLTDYCLIQSLFIFFIYLYFFSFLQICINRQSQILFLGAVGIFIAHVWCATQTRPRFNVPSERRGVTTFNITQIHKCTMPGPGFKPGPFSWEAKDLTTRPLPLLVSRLVFLLLHLSTF